MPPRAPEPLWERYLAELAQHGTKRKCAERVGLTWRAIIKRLDEDVEFRERVDFAMELCADGFEEMLVAPDLGKSQVVGLIVRLKALRPQQYIERQVSMAVNVSADLAVSPEDAKALLASLVRDMQPRTVRMLTEGARAG